MGKRKLGRADRLALAAPLAITFVAVATIGYDHGWLSGILTLTLFTGGALWLWRRRLRRLSDDRWRLHP